MTVRTAELVMAIALGLMGDGKSIETLTAAMDDALHKPSVMENAALARALLGDRDLVPDLIARLDAADCHASMVGVARAIGWAGDGRA